MKLVLILASFFCAPFTFANDGGIAALKVSEIKMREYKFDQSRGEEVEVRRINNPNFRIILEGEEAVKLQKILPSERSVMTHMYPEIEKDFKETFKAIGAYNHEVKDSRGRVLISSKILHIACTDGDLNVPSDGGRPTISKRGKTTCEIAIKGVSGNDEASEYFGGAQDFDPAEVCR